MTDMKILNIAVRVFVKEEEKYDAIKQKILEIMPADFKKEKIVLEEKDVKGFNEEKIKILTYFLEKQRHVKLFIKTLLKHLSKKQKKQLVEQAESRLDEELHFFIRLDKFKLLEGIYELTDSGECFHIKLLIASFPKKREKALDVVKEIFQS